MGKDKFRVLPALNRVPYEAKQGQHVGVQPVRLQHLLEDFVLLEGQLEGRRLRSAALRLREIKLQLPPLVIPRGTDVVGAGAQMTVFLQKCRR